MRLLNNTGMKFSGYAKISIFDSVTEGPLDVTMHMTQPTGDTTIPFAFQSAYLKSTFQFTILVDLCSDMVAGNTSVRGIELVAQCEIIFFVGNITVATAYPHFVSCNISSVITTTLCHAVSYISVSADSNFDPPPPLPPPIL